MTANPIIFPCIGTGICTCEYIQLQYLVLEVLVKSGIGAALLYSLMPALMEAICSIPVHRNGLHKPIAIKASLRPSCASTDTPTFHIIEPTADEALSEWHGF